MPFTQRAQLAERINELRAQWHTDLTLARNTSLSAHVADALIAEGWIVPEITQAEADSVVASILAIE